MIKKIMSFLCFKLHLDVVFYILRVTKLTVVKLRTFLFIQVIPTLKMSKYIN